MRTVLIADDEDGIRTLVRLTLAGQHEVLEASSGTEALELARAEVPDLVLLDVGMPDVSGFEVCRALRDDERTAGIPVLMLTARTQDSDREEAQAAGASGYFTKPFSPLQLLSRIEQILGAAGALVLLSIVARTAGASWPA